MTRTSVRVEVLDSQEESETEMCTRRYTSGAFGRDRIKNAYIRASVGMGYFSDKIRKRRRPKLFDHVGVGVGPGHDHPGTASLTGVGGSRANPKLIRVQVVTTDVAESRM